MRGEFALGGRAGVGLLLKMSTRCETGVFCGCAGTGVGGVAVEPVFGKVLLPPLHMLGPQQHRHGLMRHASKIARRRIVFVS